jgi:hypothetical protein
MTSDVNTISVDPVPAHQGFEQSVNCLGIRPDLAGGALRRDDNEREIRFAFQLVRQS